jgi:hypothetical protein
MERVRYWHARRFFLSDQYVTAVFRLYPAFSGFFPISVFTSTSSENRRISCHDRTVDEIGDCTRSVVLCSLLKLQRLKSAVT